MADFCAVSNFFPIFEAQNKTIMRRFAKFAMLAAMLLFVAACDDSVSKQFKDMEGEISSIENQINTIADCDELQMMNFAILGLRALYFALAAISRYFTYLKYGLGIILIFVGVKMLLAMNEYINALGSLAGLSINMPHIVVPTPISLAIIFGILLLSMLASVVAQHGKQENAES